MSEGWNIAVLGATGAVGEALLETLAERQFPVGEIFALARNDSAGEHLRFGGKSVIVKDAAEFDWTQAQLAFFAAGVEASAAYVEEATNAGCLVIDLSGLFALEPDVPLVVPDVNPFVLGDYRNRNLIAVPNSLTSQLLTALKPLIDQGGLSRISVTNLLSASGQGKKASAGMTPEPAYSLEVDQWLDVIRAIEQEGLWVNRGFLPGRPMYAAGVRQNGSLVVLIGLYTASEEQM